MDWDPLEVALDGMFCDAFGMATDGYFCEERRPVVFTRRKAPSRDKRDLQDIADIIAMLAGAMRL